MSNTRKPTACLICSLNCGIEAQTEGAHITRLRADKAHPVSQGYLCEKAQRMEPASRAATACPRRCGAAPTAPIRRFYEAISWDMAISEIAAKLAAVRDTHGG